MNAPLPTNEAQRLAALRRYEVLDTPAEQAFDDLVLLATHICQVPVAMVSLVDENRQWFKSRIGLIETETPRDISFCAHTILEPDRVMQVCNAEQDARFVASPLVTGAPRIRFYAGAPLVTPDGQALGALCVMDHEARVLTPEQLSALAALSRRVVAQLELSRQARELAASQREAQAMLALAEQSRRAMLSVLEDEKRAGESLRDSEARFRQVVENIREVFWMSDVAKNQILYISPGYAEVWGRPCEELYASSRAWIESIHAEDRDRVMQAAMTKQVTGNYDETYRIVRPDGAIRWVHDRAFPVTDKSGTVIRVVGVAEDVTEKRKLEKQYLRGQRLEAIGTLSGGIAHDLNNILAPMLMIAPLLRENLTHARDLELLAMVEQGAQRGADIIKQLLTFSRGIEGNRGPVQLRHLLKEMCHLMRETFPREIVIAQDAALALWPVIADATQLHQVLLNLCVNARDAMPGGGRLTLRVRNTTLTEPDRHLSPDFKPGPHVMLTVEDTGQGIPPEIIGRIFEPFFTTKEIGKGTGLGLSTVMGIVKSHGGFVCVHSEPGKGTRFEVYLPASVTQQDGGARAGVEPSLPGRGELILVVDDEASIREVMRRVLVRSGYNVLCAANGQEALTVFLAHRVRVRLLLTDVMMPTMGGVALARAVRALEPTLRIIAMSGLNDAERTQELAALGVTQVLSKPCEPQDIFEAIQRALHGAG